MTNGSVITLYRASYEKKIPDVSTGNNPTRNNWLYNTIWFASVILGVSDEVDEKVERINCFVLLLEDGSEQSFDYANSTDEIAALQKAANVAVQHGFHADAKSISLFSNGKIENLIFQKK